MDDMEDNSKVERVWRRSWLIATGAYCLAIIALSLMHPPSGVAPSFAHGDKLAHFIVYAILAALLYKAQTSEASLKRRLSIVFLSACSYGVLMECLQLALTSHRSFSWLDMLANAAGAIFALTVCALAGRRGHHAPRNHGFTLIELLLVVLIAGLAVAVAVPRFVGSFKGAQLRDAVRTVVRMHRYARSSAVLEQGEGALLFDVAKGTITLIGIPRDEEAAGFLDDRRQDSIFADEDTEELPETETLQITEKVERALPEGISIADFVGEMEDQEIDGIFWVNYFPNGMCDPYRLSIVDAERKATVRIEVDSVSGRIEVEYE